MTELQLPFYLGLIFSMVIFFPLFLMIPMRNPLTAKALWAFIIIVGLLDYFNFLHVDMWFLAIILGQLAAKILGVIVNAVILKKSVSDITEM